VEDVTGAGGCTLNAGYVADVTVPDNTEVAAGTGYVKTWRIRNSGTCDWGSGFELAFVDGDAMGGSTVAVPATAAGATQDVSLNLTAPGGRGTYRGNFRMRSDTGASFGSTLYVQIVVPGGSSDPTEEPPDEPTEEPTEEPPDEEPEYEAPTNLRAVREDDGRLTFRWDDGVGESRYEFNYAYIPREGGVASERASDLAADTESWTTDHPVSCGGDARFTLYAMAPGGLEIGDPLSTDVSTGLCGGVVEAVSLEPSARGTVNEVEGVWDEVFCGIGDTSDREGLRCFLTFDLSEIPDGSTITDARLRFDATVETGDPWDSMGYVYVYYLNYGSLNAGDYGRPAGGPAITTYASKPNIQAGEGLSAAGISRLQDALAGNQFQVRVQFVRETDDDSKNDYLTMFGGIVLEVTYTP
jgi:hypothetical protein